ncbi:MAG TPA: DUF1330 domain-containing protein [Solirubrobacteraceae bacterium]|nr:DUF1330 domain-containing protein [Solirubrobacteraceae bacterium]
MKAYAIAHLQPGPMHPDIAAYVEQIEATLEPFGGRYLIHGGPVDVREGEWQGDLVAIEFPSREQATAWYESAAYQAIMPLRTRHLVGPVILMDGVRAGHRATDVLSQAA